MLLNSFEQRKSFNKGPRPILLGRILEVQLLILGRRAMPFLVFIFLPGRSRPIFAAAHLYIFNLSGGNGSACAGFESCAPLRPGEVRQAEMAQGGPIGAILTPWRTHGGRLVRGDQTRSILGTTGHAVPLALAVLQEGQERGFPPPIHLFHLFLHEASSSRPLPAALEPCVLGASRTAPVQKYPIRRVAAVILIFATTRARPCAGATTIAVPVAGGGVPVPIGGWSATRVRHAPPFIPGLPL
mmetsp:Transcript_6358/g.7953  ORF Transcript_6358/g.7953 Transcript_6358/m.7953 type:complete len:242 (-) Transcript_6358:673-1398(-)